MDENKLKLIYVNKIGYNAKGEGLYEFIFSLDPTNIDIEAWCWDLSPAVDNAQPPTEDYTDLIVNLKTSSFDLKCLHEAVDRPYMHGYHTIHALAYEDEEAEFNDDSGKGDYEKMFENSDDDAPLLVFHYGMSFGIVEELLSNRDIRLK